MSQTTTRFVLCLAVALLAVPAALADDLGTVAAPEAAAAADIKACYQNVIKKCCDVASGVDLTIECSDDEYTWICVGAIHQNPLIDSTTAAEEGLKFSRTVGVATCEYQKPECGTYAGDCRLASDVTAATCDIKRAVGDPCVSPDLLAEDGGFQNERAGSDCHF